MTKITYMIRTSAKVLTSLAMFAGISSCQLRDIEDPDSLAHISIDVDWSKMDEVPSGMTVIFYPEDGSKPYQYVTNNVHHIEKDLPEKDYDILIFNQSVEEFKSINFKGMDKLETAEIYAPESEDIRSRLDRLYQEGTKGYSTTVLMKPRNVGSGKSNAKATITRSYQSKLVITPTPKIGQLSATIYVKGLNNALRVNGALTALAAGKYFGIDKLNNISLTQEMDQWDINLSADSSVGYISSVIGTFGLSTNINYKYNTISRADNSLEYIESAEEDEYRNILYLNFLLKDYTYASYRFDVTDYIKDFTYETSVELVLDLGTDLESYITLPESGLPYETTPISVNPWEEGEVEHFIKM